jgi:hypothetical protein
VDNNSSFFSMQHEVLLTNAVMPITQPLKEYDIVLHITYRKFGCGSAALGLYWFVAF